jgi:hypothetical protein
VNRIERGHPNTLTVRLNYREPVAESLWVDRTDLKPIVVDGEGVILPLSDLNRAGAGPLLSVVAEHPPVDARPGRFWGTSEPPDNLSQPDPRIAAAARVAAFLKARQASERTRLGPVSIIQVNPNYPGGLVIVASDQSVILWGVAPGCEPPGELTADEKWSLLRAWFETPGRGPVKYPTYLEITPRGVKPVPARGSQAG